MSKKSENKQVAENQNSAQNVKFYFLSPSGSSMHSREYPLGKTPIGAIWCAVDGKGEICYRTTSSKALMNSDRKAVKSENGYTLVKDGVKTVFTFLGETEPMTASDPRVLAYLASHVPQAVAEPKAAKNTKKVESKKSGKNGRK